MKQLSSSRGWIVTSLYGRYSPGWKLDSSHCSQPRSFAYRPICSPGTASQLQRGRKPSPSLIRKHQKADRRHYWRGAPLCSCAANKPLFYQMSLILLFPKYHPAKVGRSSINKCVYYLCHFLVQFRGWEKQSGGKKGPAALPLEWTSSVWQISQSAAEIRRGFRFLSLSHAVAEYQEINSFRR